MPGCCCLLVATATWLVLCCPGDAPCTCRRCQVAYQVALDNCHSNPLRWERGDEDQGELAGSFLAFNKG